VPVSNSFHIEPEQLDTIVRSVPGGLDNVQDIYPLSPLQEGMLFHRLLNKHRDTYVLATAFELQTQAEVDAIERAIQCVIDRHDVLRSSIVWDQLPRPLQIVQRHAQLRTQNFRLDSTRDPVQQLLERMRPERQRIDLQQPPLVRLSVGPAGHGKRWYAVLHVHHIVCDHQSLEQIVSEIFAIMSGRGAELSDPVPFRTCVEQALVEVKEERATAHFTSKLADVAEVTAPFGLVDVHGDGSRIEEARRVLDAGLTAKIRSTGVSVARLSHAACALVVAHASGREDVVFGTVLAAGRRRMTRPTVGLFVNTLPLRLQLQSLSCRELVAQVDAELSELTKFSQTPLTLAQGCSGLSGAGPLFTSLLNCRRSPGSEQESEGAAVRTLGRVEAWTNYPLTVIVDDCGTQIVLLTQTDRKVDPGRINGYMITAMNSLLEALAHAPEMPARLLGVIPDDEVREVIFGNNSTQMPYPEQKLLYQLFEEQVERTPHEVAVLFDGECLTYRQLNCRSNQLARHLQKLGAGPDRFVGLYVERGTEMAVGLLGIIKSGAAYVPLDPNYPEARLDYILKDAAPIAVLTQERLKGRLTVECPVLALDSDWNQISVNLATNPPAAASSANLAYLIYTSGSTGRPKGAAIEHRNAVNLVAWAQTTLSPECFERTLHSTSLNFDLSVYEFFVPLSSGGSIRVVPNALALLSGGADVTLINTVPSAIKGVLDGGTIPGSARVVNLAGEALRQELVERIFANSSVECVCNLYGPSETTTYSTWIQMTRQEGFDASIGRPVGNTQVYILDSQGKPVALGVTGEIYIGGGGVARGYHNQPELTAQRFMADPFSGAPGARMYKTGDVGRWRRDGTIEYLGRNDHQVKIRGFRIELGEIESQLARHEHVKEAVVIAREDVPGDRRLVAYVVPDQCAPCVEELSAVLRTALPDYMIPSAYVMLERLPLTSNGKLDRFALPMPDVGAHRNREYVAPEGEVEEILAGIWQGLLRLDRVGRRDHFFALGGHSLLIVQLLERLRRVGLAADVRSVFDNPVLSDLARVLESGFVAAHEIPPNAITADCQNISPAMLPLLDLQQHHIDRIIQSVPRGIANLQDIYPLAPLQEGILFHHLFSDRAGDAYVLPLLLSAASRERMDELLGALQRVVDRHDILRTAVLWEDLPQAVQVVHRQARLPVEQVAARSLEQAQRWLDSEQQRIDIRQAPMLRVRVAPDAASEHWYVLLLLHHLTIDHMTLEKITAEIVAQLQGRAHTLCDPIPYRRHVAHVLAHARTHDAAAFFTSKLGDVDEPTAPFGVLDTHRDGTRTSEKSMAIAPRTSRSVRAQARLLGVSAATLFHAAWSLVVAHTSGRDDVVFGSVFLGRMQGDVDGQRILGVFINTLPVRLQLKDKTIKQLVEYAQREIIDLLSHEQSSLAVAQRCSGVVAPAPLFTSLLNYRHSVSDLTEQWEEASGVSLLAIRERTNYPITVSVDDFGDRFSITAKTDHRIDAARLVGYLSTAVDNLVAMLASAPEMPALTVRILPDSERRDVIESFNQTRVPYPHNALIHEIFEQQVRRTPGATAVMFEDRSLTYRDLNARAETLARCLRQMQVGPDEIVALCVERSLEMVIGVLGILRTGAAYLALDPDYPSERLAYMIGDAAPRVLLTQRHLRKNFPTTAAVLEIDSEWEGSREERNDSDAPAQLHVGNSSQLAYLIYTSGSTGKPKGVMVEHGNVLSLLRSLEHIYRQSPGCQRIAVNASLNFDASVKQFIQLLSGRTIVVVPQQVRWDATAMLDFMESHSVDGIDCTPSQLKSWIAAGLLRRKHQPRVVLIGGETIDAELWTQLSQSTRIDFYNVYGPTESTVDATFAHIEGNRPPHIGWPMENRQIYILGRGGQPAPIGATGEIFIGGAGIARGYYGQPKLTSERFGPNPFGEGRLYRTGDLARWCADGAIEYIGRNDQQVKIRGVRIELSEVEACLLGHPGVLQAVAIAREDSPGDKRIVAYVEIDNDAIETGASVAELLRKYLLSFLPEYMVPSAFVVLEALPLTSNGKLDRRSLPPPDVSAYAARKYEPPIGDVEETLAQIWQELLGVRRVGRDDSFFELGGHSLLVMRALLKLNDRMATSLRVADVYRNPTLKELALRVVGGLRSHEHVNLATEAVLDPAIAPVRGLRRVPGGDVLLTGATGFVGRFLLARLLTETRSKIYCLVRGQSQQDATSRVISTLMDWDLWREEFAGRVVALCGDLRKPRLGLEVARYETVCKRVDTIYHCATSMNHLETYEMARPANVGAAAELARMSVEHRLKLINYVSTLSLFTPGDRGTARSVNERSTIEYERHSSANGYAASKWVAEKIFMLAGERGIPVNIYRLGLIWADSELGRYDHLQRVYRILKSSILTGVGIRDYRPGTTPIPVDVAARAIVLLSERHMNGGGIFHLTSSEPLREGIFERCNAIGATSLELLSFYDWILHMKGQYLRGLPVPALPLIEFAFSMDEDTFWDTLRRDGSASLEFECSQTQSELEQCGVRIPGLNDDLLRTCVESMLMRDDGLRSMELGQRVADVRHGMTFA